MADENEQSITLRQSNAHSRTRRHQQNDRLHRDNIGESAGNGSDNGLTVSNNKIIHYRYHSFITLVKTTLQQ